MDTIAEQVAKYVQESGIYSLADSQGRRLKEVKPDAVSLGILKKPERYGKIAYIFTDRRDNFIATITFETSNKWLFYVYGEQYLNEMKDFLKGLPVPEGVTVEFGRQRSEPFKEDHKIWNSWPFHETKYQLTG